MRLLAGKANVLHAYAQKGNGLSQATLHIPLINDLRRFADFGAYLLHGIKIGKNGPRGHLQLGCDIARADAGRALDAGNIERGLDDFVLGKLHLGRHKYNLPCAG